MDLKSTCLSILILIVFNLCNSQCILSQGNDILSRISKLRSNGLALNIPFKKNVPCTCGIFLDDDLTHGNEMPVGNPALSKELEIPMLPCGTQGNKLCSNKCLDTMVHHLATSGNLVCASINRDCHKEKANLFVKNCDDKWRSTGLTMGKEYCCVNGMNIKCPKLIGKLKPPPPGGMLSALLDSSPDARTIPELLLDFADRAADIATDVLQIN